MLMGSKIKKEKSCGTVQWVEACGPADENKKIKVDWTHAVESQMVINRQAVNWDPLGQCRRGRSRISWKRRKY